MDTLLILACSHRRQDKPDYATRIVADTAAATAPTYSRAVRGVGLTTPGDARQRAASLSCRAADRIGRTPSASAVRSLPTA